MFFLQPRAAFSSSSSSGLRLYSFVSQKSTPEATGVQEKLARSSVASDPQIKGDIMPTSLFTFFN